MPDEDLILYRKEIIDEVEINILPFWINKTVDIENGGFYGSIDNHMNISKEASKGSVLLSRILWTFSSAFKIFKKPLYMQMAERAYKYLNEYAIDKKFGGIYWLINFKGKPLETKKQIYAQAFAIYALTEYFSITNNNDALDTAKGFFQLIEKYSYDEKFKGYIEACNEDWSDLTDMNLSKKDLNCRKSMNTNLHILEAYTNLLRYWKDEKLKTRLRELIIMSIDHIIDPITHHFKLYFNDDWTSLNDRVSYGHDIEGSWLLYEASEVLGDKEILQRVKDISIKMAEVTYKEGIDKKGSIVNEGNSNGITDYDRDWWPQAEAMVGFFNAYQLTGDNKYLKASIKVWDFVKKYFVDKKYGEWFWSINKYGKVCDHYEKIGFWKCPYHNSRACFELKNRIDILLNKPQNIETIRLSDNNLLKNMIKK